jgi:hypothetical protein
MNYGCRRSLGATEVRDKLVGKSGREVGIASAPKNIKVCIGWSGVEKGKVGVGVVIALVGRRFRRKVTVW